MALPPDWNNPIIVSRKGYSKNLVGIHLGKRFDWPRPFALVMLILLVGLFVAGAVLVSSEYWYLGAALIAAAVCLFLLMPISRRPGSWAVDESQRDLNP